MVKIPIFGEIKPNPSGQKDRPTKVILELGLFGEEYFLIENTSGDLYDNQKSSD